MAQIRVMNRPREEDERDLEVLRLRQAGWSMKEIAARFGLKPYQLRHITGKVKEDDMAVPDPLAQPKDYARAYQ